MKPESQPPLARLLHPSYLLTPMTLFHHLQHSSRAIAFWVAVWLMAASCCPAGWFVCRHADGEMALVDRGHAGLHVAAHDHDCSHDDIHDCRDDLAGGVDGCLDLPVSLTADFQLHVLPVVVALPSCLVIDLLPDARQSAMTRCLKLRELVGGPPPHPFVRHVRLLV